MELNHRLRMRWCVGVKSTQETHLVDVLGRLRKQLGHPRPRGAVLAKLKLRSREPPATWPRLAIALLQLWFVLPGIHLRNGSLHEQEDHSLRLGRNLRRLSCCLTAGGHRRERLLGGTQQRRQRQRTKP